MRLKKTLVATPLVALLLASCTGGDSNEAAPAPGGDIDVGQIDEMELTVTTTIGSADSYANAAMLAYLDEIERASEGRITYEFFAGGALVPAPEVGEALSTGIVDVAMTTSSQNPATHPVDDWLSEFGYAGSLQPPAALLERSAAALNWWMNNEEARDIDYTQNGMIFMTQGISPLPYYALICNDPVRSLAEARGSQVRTGGGAWADEATALGMTPVTMPGGEVYEAMQRGIVDCNMQGPVNIVDSKIWEVAKEYTDIEFARFASWGMFLSETTWDSMSEETKDLFWEALPVYLETDMRESLDYHSQFFAEVEEHGVTIHQPDDDMLEALASYREEARQTAPERAPRGLSDPAGRIDEYFALHDTWATVVAEDLGYEEDGSWQEWANNNTAEDVDLQPWVDRVWGELLADNRPD